MNIHYNIYDLLPLLCSKDHNDYHLALNIIDNQMDISDIPIEYLLFLMEYEYRIIDKELAIDNNKLSIVYMFHQHPQHGTYIDIFTDNAITTYSMEWEWVVDGKPNPKLLKHIKTLIEEWKI